MHQDRLSWTHLVVQYFCCQRNICQICQSKISILKAFLLTVIKSAHPRCSLPKGQKLLLLLSTKGMSFAWIYLHHHLKLLCNFLENSYLNFFLEHSFHAGPLRLANPYGCSVANSEVQDLLWSSHILFHKHSEEGSTLNFFHSPRAGTPAHLCCAEKFQKPENTFNTDQRIRVYPLFRERPLKKKRERDKERERGPPAKCNILVLCIMDFFLRSGYEPKLVGSFNWHTDSNEEHMHYLKKSWEGLPINSCSFHEFLLHSEYSQHLTVGAGGTHLTLFSMTFPAISGRLNYNRLPDSRFLVE